MTNAERIVREYMAALQKQTNSRGRFDWALLGLSTQREYIAAMEDLITRGIVAVPTVQDEHDIFAEILPVHFPSDFR